MKANEEELDEFYKKEATAAKRRTSSLYKEKGIPTCILSEAEMDEWIKGGLHKYRCAWHPVYEPRISTLQSEKVIKCILDGKIELSQMREYWNNEVSDENEKFFKKKGWKDKSSAPTRAQRAIFYENIRFFISEHLSDKNVN